MSVAPQSKFSVRCVISADLLYDWPDQAYSLEKSFWTRFPKYYHWIFARHFLCVFVSNGLAAPEAHKEIEIMFLFIVNK